MRSRDAILAEYRAGGSSRSFTPSTRDQGDVRRGGYGGNSPLGGFGASSQQRSISMGVGAGASRLRNTYNPSSSSSYGVATAATAPYGSASSSDAYVPYGVNRGGTATYSSSSGGGGRVPTNSTAAAYQPAVGLYSSTGLRSGYGTAAGSSNRLAAGSRSSSSNNNTTTYAAYGGATSARGTAATPTLIGGGLPLPPSAERTDYRYHSAAGDGVGGRSSRGGGYGVEDGRHHEEYYNDNEQYALDGDDGERSHGLLADVARNSDRALASSRRGLDHLSSASSSSHQYAVARSTVQQRSLLPPSSTSGGASSRLQRHAPHPPSSTSTAASTTGAGRYATNTTGSSGAVSSSSRNIGGSGGGDSVGYPYGSGAAPPPSSSLRASAGSGAGDGGSYSMYGRPMSGGGGHSSSSALVSPSSCRSAESPFGFRNLGNTCYLNASLQAFIASPYFVEEMLRQFGLPSSSSASSSIASFISRKVPTGMAKDLLELIYGGRGGGGGSGSPSSPSSVSHILSSIKAKCRDRNVEFTGARQNDAHELIRVLMLILHENVNRVEGKPKYVEMKDIPGESHEAAAERWWEYHLTRDDSIVYDCFGGQQQSIVQCRKCKHESLSFDPFLDLFLNFPQGSTRNPISFLLTAYTGAMRLEGADRYYCSKCKGPQDSTRQVLIARFPKILALALIRFDRRGRKDGSAVLIEERLVTDADCCITRETFSYELYSVVVHSGTMDYGHYYAYVKKGSQWYCCDDSSVRPVTFGIVQQESAGVYMLYYRMVRG